MIRPNPGPTLGNLHEHGLELGRVCLEIVNVEITSYSVRVSGIAAERDTGDNTPLTFQYTRKQGVPAVEALRHALHEFVCHEIDEQIKQRGLRIFDPHTSYERPEVLYGERYGNPRRSRF